MLHIDLNISQITVTKIVKLISMDILDLLLNNISVEILITKCSGLFTFDSYIRGFHAYKQNWDPVVGRRYPCVVEEKNEHDEYAVAVINDDEVVGHIPLRLSKIMTMFLKLTGSYIEAEVTGKYVNRGAGYGLELPCIYHITGQEKAVLRLSHKIDSIMKKHELIVNRCLDKEKKEKQ